MKRIAGTKIRMLREELGLTQEDLAKAVGLSSEFISHLELGKRDPSLGSLSALAGFFQKDPSFFLVEREESFDILFKREEFGPAEIKGLRRFRTYCEDYLDLEEMTGQPLGLAPLYSRIRAEEMAGLERRRLGLGGEPIHDVFSLVERNGLRVYRAALSEAAKVAAVFLFLERRQAAFTLVNTALSPGLQVLMIAHAYAHFLRDRLDGPIVDNTDILIEDYIGLYPARERYAQVFACQFLMPSESIREIIGWIHRRDELSYPDVIYLTRMYGVETTDMIQMLLSLQLLSQRRVEQFQHISGASWEKILFGSTASSQARRCGRRLGPSDRFRYLALQAFQRKKISGQELARFLSLKPESITKNLSGKS